MIDYLKPNQFRVWGFPKMNEVLGQTTQCHILFIFSNCFLNLLCLKIGGLPYPHLNHSSRQCSLVLLSPQSFHSTARNISSKVLKIKVIQSWSFNLMLSIILIEEKLHFMMDGQLHMNLCLKVKAYCIKLCFIRENNLF